MGICIASTLYFVFTREHALSGGFGSTAKRLDRRIKKPMIIVGI